MEEKINSCSDIFRKVSVSTSVSAASPSPEFSLPNFEGFRKDFRRLRSQPCHPKVHLTLTTALALDGVPYRSQGYHVKLTHPRYGFIGNRHQLRRVLSAIALTDAHLGFDKDLIVLASTILAITNCEASAYAMMAGILEKFRFKQLLIPEFDPEFKGSQGQAAMIVSNYQCFCPATYDALCKAGLKQRLLDIVAQWLRSFFCTGFNPERQSLQDFQRLLDAVLEVEVHQADPYRELRQICVYILMRNSGRLLAAAKAQKLAAELENLAGSVIVRKEFFHVLKEMNSENVAPWSPEDMASFLPMSLVAGCCCILELDTLFPGSSIAIPVACACVGMVAGYMDGFKSLISRFARPPKDVMGDSIWADDEEPFPNDAKVMSDPESAEEHSDVVEPDEEPDFEFFRALDRYRLEQMPLEYPVQPGFQGYPGWQISSGSFPQYVASGWNGWEEAW